MAGSNALFQMWPLLQRNRPISYSSNIAHIVGSVKAAILLSQMIYWTKKGVSVKANDGWFHKQAEHWTMETGLTRHEQDTSRKLLVQLEFLEVKHKTSDGKKAHGMVSYRINLDRIGQALADLVGETILAMNPLNLDDLQMDSQIVRQLFGKPVSYHRALVDITGGATSALLLSRMIYLQRRAYSANGGDWFSVTTEFYRQELGMNRRQQESARKALKTNKLIFESLLEDQIRRTRRLYQCVNIPALIPALEKMLVDQAAIRPDMPPSPDATARATYKTGNLNEPTQVQNRQPETDQGCRKRTRVVAENVHGRLPEMYVYTSEELQGFELQVRTTTTTTTTADGLNTDVSATPSAVVVVPQKKEAKADSADSMASLFFPKGIAGQELADFGKWVKKALPHRRQLLIDEFEYQRKRRIITSPVGYIRKLVERDHEAQGELPLEGAYAVAKNRAAAAAQQKVLQVPEAPRTEAGIEMARKEIEQVKALLKSNRRQA
jgi:hypothetical protein